MQPIFLADFTGSGEDGVLFSVDAAGESSYPLVLDAETIHKRARARVPHHPVRSASRASSAGMSKAETMRLRAAAAAITLLCGDDVGRLRRTHRDLDNCRIHRHSGWHPDLGCLCPRTQGRRCRWPPSRPNRYRIRHAISSGYTR
jgi:hypothetical protein